MVNLLVMTSNMGFYYELTHFLRLRGYSFQSTLPTDRLSFIPELVLTTDLEREQVIKNLNDQKLMSTGLTVIGLKAPFSYDLLEKKITKKIIEIKAGHWKKLVIGVDPGRIFGIVALVNNMVVRKEHAHTPISASIVVGDILRALGSEENILRVGNKAPRFSHSFLEIFLRKKHSKLRIEMVNEYGSNRAKRTTSNTFKSVDLAAATKIARTPGKTLVKLSSLRDPSKGEIRQIQHISRKLTHGQVSISEEYAKKVVTGEISLKKAVEEFMKKGGS
ncbi:MAG: hypothetical protein ACTSW4_03585 [Candidatus Ranarchaeia archaeon]